MDRSSFVSDNDLSTFRSTWTGVQVLLNYYAGVVTLIFVCICKYGFVFNLMSFDRFGFNTDRAKAKDRDRKIV